MILLLDQDEVLCDFVGAACRIHGSSRERMEQFRRNHEWDISYALGRATEKDLSQDKFWLPIHEAGIEFWENLEPLPWFSDVIGWAENNFDEWYVVSAPSRETSSYTGKVLWLKRQFGYRFDRFFLTPHKEMLAFPSRLLLDDRQDNLKKFKAHGGKCLLFPTLGGRLYEHAHDPMKILLQSKYTRGTYEDNG